MQSDGNMVDVREDQSFYGVIELDVSGSGTAGQPVRWRGVLDGRGYFGPGAAACGESVSRLPAEGRHNL